MAKNDIRIYSTGGLPAVPTVRWQTEAAATAILAGEPVKLKAAGSPYVIPLADADLTLGTDVQFIGIAKSDSTQTAGADGFVDVYYPMPGIVYEAKAKTAASVNTQSEIDALCGDRKIFDLTSSTYTVDEAAADNVANAVLIVGGNPDQQTLRFMIERGTNAVAGA